MPVKDHPPRPTLPWAPFCYVYPLSPFSFIARLLQWTVDAPTFRSFLKFAVLWSRECILNILVYQCRLTSCGQSVNKYKNELNILCLKEGIRIVLISVWLLIFKISLKCEYYRHTWSATPSRGLFWFFPIKVSKVTCFCYNYTVILILAGEGVPPGNYGNYGYANSGYSACEEENERLTESLRSKVTAIKSVSI